LRGPVVGLADQYVAGFGAEMRHIDHGCGVVGQQLEHLARGDALQPLAGLQNGQGAQEPGGVQCLGGRRRVFYIPGYDPFHPRRYRELYRTESAQQAEISGYEISQSAKDAGDGFGWGVASVMDGVPVEAEVDVLVWSDIVRGSMATGIFATYVQLIRTAWIYIASGALRRLMMLRKGPVIAALYPVVVLIGQLALAVLAGALVSRLVLAGLGLVFTVPGWLGWAVFLGSVAGVGGAVLRWFKASGIRRARIWQCRCWRM